MIRRLRKVLLTPGTSQLCIVLGCVLCLALARAADGPELYLSLQGVADDTVGQGEPLRVSVLIEAYVGDTEPYLLAPASGSWVDAVAVEILAADGDTVVARAQAVGQPDEPAATVDREHIAGGLWRFPADVIQPLSPGAYRLHAKLTISDGPGWRGTAASDELPLTVLPLSDDPARAALKALALARDALLSGDLETAAQTLDVQLAGDPSNFRLLLLRATVAEQAGNLPAAQMLLNLAHLENPDNPGSYPNPDFEETSGRVMAGLLSGSTGSAPSEPPDWSWPPESVLRALVERMPAEATAEEELIAPAAADVAPASTDAPVSEPAVVAEPAVQATPATSATDSISSDGDAPRYWLGDQAVPASSNGQWATSARAGSQYGEHRTLRRPCHRRTRRARHR